MTTGRMIPTGCFNNNDNSFSCLAWRRDFIDVWRTKGSPPTYAPCSELAKYLERENSVTSFSFTKTWKDPSEDRVFPHQAVHINTSNISIEFRHHWLRHLQHCVPVAGLHSCFQGAQELCWRRPVSCTPLPAGLHDAVPVNYEIMSSCKEMYFNSSLWILRSFQRISYNSYKGEKNHSPAVLHLARKQ